MAATCGCASSCAVHGHDHAAALGANVPAADVQSFWGAFGCGCWAVLNDDTRTHRSTARRPPLCDPRRSPPHPSLHWSSGIAKLFDLGGALGEARHFGREPARACRR